jgi:hypothetical protein
MQSYSRLIYPGYSSDPFSTSGNASRQALMRLFPGAKDFQDKSSNLISSVDTVNGKYVNAYHDVVMDESASMFIDRPFTDLGYEQVMDVYGYIGDPYKVYKKVSRPEDIDKAVGVAVFVYSLEEKIDLSDRSMPINIGYYVHGGLNFGQPKAENPGRTLADGSGTYIEIQNEHNYMGGSSQKVLNEGTVPTQTSGEEKGLMTIAHKLNTPPTCYRAGTVDFEPLNFLAAESAPELFKERIAPRAGMPGFKSDTDQTPHRIATPACGSARLPLTATRLFRFPEVGQEVDPPQYLPDPLWLAAKYGGFNDANFDGVPQDDEFDLLPSPNGDGIPDNYFYAATLSELKEKLSEAFERIMSTMNVGTATSASVNSVLGGGVTVRT